MITKVYEEIDGLLRDPRFDPFVRKDGNVVKTSKKHPILQQIKKDYGVPVWQLLMTKRLEIEQFNPSGHYPTKVLWKDGQKLKVYEAIEHLHDKLKEVLDENGGGRK